MVAGHLLRPGLGACTAGIRYSAEPRPHARLSKSTAPDRPRGPIDGDSWRTGSPSRPSSPRLEWRSGGPGLARADQPDSTGIPAPRGRGQVPPDHRNAADLLAAASP